MSRLALGMKVMVYDRYRFAIPLEAMVTLFSETTDGVQVVLEKSNSKKYSVGSRVWVHHDQLKPIVRGVATSINWEEEYKIQGKELQGFIDERESLVDALSLAYKMRDVWRQAYYRMRALAIALGLGIFIVMGAWALP